MVLPPDHNPAPPPDAAGFLHRDASGDSPLLPDAKDSGNADQHRMEMMQSSLVERIADVDDERRRSAAQMHRALETHSAEMTTQMRRRWQSLLLIVGSMILLTAVMLGYLQLQSGARVDEMLAALDRLEQRVATMETVPETTDVSLTSQDQGAIPLLRFQTERLGDRITGLSERVGRLVNEVAVIKAPAAPSSDPADAESVGPGGASVAIVSTPESSPGAAAADRASAPKAETAPPASEPGVSRPEADAAAIARAVLESLGTPAASEQPGADDGVSAQVTAESDADPDAEVESDAVDPPASGQDRPTSGKQPNATEDAEAAAIEPDAKDADAASLDALVEALIEGEASEVGREYQRLARQVAAPAVRSRDGLEVEDDDGVGIVATDPEPSLPGPAADQASGSDAGVAESVDLVADAESPDQIQLAERPFVLQLIGFFSRDLMNAFIERSTLPPEVYTMEETFRGRPWFVLIHSLHPNRVSAQEVIAGLPQELADLDLWIRELPADTELEVIPTAGGQVGSDAGD